MLKLFQNTKPTTVLLIILLGFVMKWQAFVYPIFPEVSKGHFMFDLILGCLKILFGKSAISFSFLSVSLLIAQSYYLNFIVSKHKLFVLNGFLPAFSFLLLTSLFPSLNYFNEQLILNFFVLAAFEKILGFSHSSNSRTEIFNAGFLMTIPFLFQLSGFGFWVLFFVSLALLRPFHLAEWVVGIIGLFTPIYFFVCSLFLFNKMEVLHQFPLLSFNYLQSADFKRFHFGLLLGFFLLIAFGLFALLQNLPKVTIYVRRSWLIVVSYCMLAIGILFLITPKANQGWILVLPPLCLIISQSFCLEKTKWFSSFTFYFSIVLFIFSQLI